MRYYLLLCLPLFALCERGFAYPGYIGFGYSQCLTCHYNPLGDGPLTDYGRALSAIEISGKLLASGRSDEEIAKASGFLGPLGELPSWLRLEAQYRGLYLQAGIQSDKPNRRWINMQADLSAILKFMEDKLVAVGTLGYTPTPATASSTSNLISRQHYVGYKPLKSFGVYAGMMDVAFGIHIPDHNAFLRSRTVLDKNDQVHGVLLNFFGKSWDSSLHLFAGNLFQDADLRQKGLSDVTEFEVLENFRVGGSLLATSGTFRSRQMAAFHARLGIGKGSSILAELGLVRDVPVGQTTKLGDVYFLQSMIRLFPGLYLLMTFEHYAQDFTTSGPRFYRIGPSIDYIPFQRVEFRLDFLGSRTLGTGTLNPDVYTVQSQVNIWL